MYNGVSNLKKAVAVKYISEFPAPFIIAKGKDQLAKKIIHIARDNNIGIIKEEILAERLIDFTVGDFIPEEVYEIVAEILAFVYRTQKKTELI